MNNKADFQIFFETNNSSTNKLHYDLVAEKFLTGIEDHQRKQYHNSSSLSDGFALIGAIIQIVFGLVVFIIASVFHLFKSPK